MYDSSRITTLLLGVAFAIAAAPGAVAAQAGAGPTFSVERGHFETPFTLVVTAPEPGMTLRVTTDGSDPSLDTGSARTVPAPTDGTAAQLEFAVDGTMSVRALASNGATNSETVTHSFVFPAQVLRQSAPVNSHPAWGNDGADWEMDPEIVGHDDPESRLVERDMLEIPAVYLSVPFDEMWGDGGIYIEGEGEARETSVELLNPAADADDPNAVAGLQMDGTVEITGGSSTERWKTDKLSMRLRFPGGVDFPVFEHAGTRGGPEPTGHFNTLILDARLNESWLHPDEEQRVAGQHVRDQFIADLQMSMGGLAPHGRFVHLYVGGLYWGLYTLHERPDHHFAEQYRGGDSSDWTVMKHDRDDVVHGEAGPFDELRELFDGSDIDSPETFARIEALMDVEDFARYMVLNYWAGNTDWSHQNWYASFRPDDVGRRWRFHAWDSEHTLKSVREDVTGKDDDDSPTGFHRRLMENPLYQAVFQQVVDEARLPGGVLDPEFTARLYADRASEIDGATRAESARWGDNRRDRPFTRGDEWVAERRRLLEEYFPGRTDVVLDQFRRRGWIR